MRSAAAGRAGAAWELVGATLRRRRDIAKLGGWALLGALPTFAAGQAMARAVDRGFLAGQPLIGLAWLAGLAATVPLGAFGARATYVGVARLVEPMRDDLVRLVVGRALWRATNQHTRRDASAVARLTQHVETVRDMVAGLLLLVLSFVGSVVAAVVGLCTLAPVVVPLVIGPLLLSLGGFLLCLRRLIRQQRRLLLADEALAELASEATSSLRDIVACGAEERVAAQLEQAIDDQMAAGQSLAGTAALRTLVVSLGSRLPLVFVLLLAGWLLRRGMSPGTLLGTITYLLQGLGPAVKSLVGGLGSPLALLTVTLRRIDEADEVSPGLSDWNGNGASVIPKWPVDARLDLRDVTFRYRAAAEPVVNGLDLEIPDGDHLVIVGPSGAGKSTLAALLVGMLQPQAGTIRHGGQPVRDVDVRARVLIPQEAYVFRGTLGENLLYLHPDAGIDALDAAVEALGMQELVARLGGYGAEIEPGRLSAGERQLVALARAFVSQARLTVLDEATCHLDPTAEAVAEHAFAARGGTLVIVAHRISSARRGRRILVMDGLHTLLGDHDSLVERSSLYRNLVGHWGSAPDDGSQTRMVAGPRLAQRQ